MTMAMAPARAGSRAMERVAWLGLCCGLLCFAVGIATVNPPRLYASAGLPSPEAITGYVTAICGALLTVANTAYIIWHKFHPGPKPTRKKRPKKPDATPPPSPAH